MCKFFNTGHCKHILKGCKFTHAAEIGSSYRCRNKRCNERHPKKCKYKQTVDLGKNAIIFMILRKTLIVNLNEWWKRNPKDSINQSMKTKLLKQIKEKTEYTKNIEREILNESVRIYLSVIETLVEAKEQEEEINKKYSRFNF